MVSLKLKSVDCIVYCLTSKRSSIFSPEDVKEVIKSLIKKTKLELEYIEIVNPKTLLSIDEWMPGAQACLAAYCGEVRLIDNWQMTSFE